MPRWPDRLPQRVPTATAVTEGARELRVERGGVRLDKFLADALRCGRRGARTLIRGGCVAVDDHVAATAVTLTAGQIVRVRAAADTDTAAGGTVGDDRPDPKVIARGQGWVALAKPAGLHSVAGASVRSVADWLVSEYPGAAAVATAPRDAGLVHRLDRDTSGVLIAATDRSTWLRLRLAFTEHRVVKQYLAIVAGRVDAVTTVDRSLARRRSRVRPPRRGEKAYRAETTFHPLDSNKSWSLVLATMRTGVTHQIRAHAALAGFPIIGDMKYGNTPSPDGIRPGHLLHALRLVVEPGIDVTAPPDEEFRRALARLRAS